MSEEINESVPTEAVEQSPATVAEDGTIKLDMRQVQEPQEEVVEEAVSEEPVAEVQEVVAEEPIEEAPAPIQEPTEVLQEITEEEVEEVTEQLHEDVTEAIQESKEKGIDLPENIQKVVDFMNETGGDLEDYVKLNTDYASLDEDSLLKEYYQQANPLLDNEDINFLIEESFLMMKT